MSNAAAIRALIVDDEAPARSRLRHLLKSEPDLEIVGEAANGRQALEAVRTLKPDLLLIDVQMPGLNGLQVCAELGAGELPAVVFVTAYDRFALQAFEVHAVDYLLKPIDRERLQRTLQHLRSRLGTARPRPEENRELQALIAELRHGRRSPERLAIKVDGRVLFLRTAEIDWLEAEGNYVRLHVGNTNHLFRDTLSALEGDLPVERFLRISRSVIVNLDAVKELQPLFYGDYSVVLRNGKQLTLSRSYRDRIEQFLERRG